LSYAISPHVASSRPIGTSIATIDSLRRLRAHGIAIALDDFGTGFSSLASLEQLPLTRIKLDRSLVASIDTSARSASIAKAIIQLCQGLGPAFRGDSEDYGVETGFIEPQQEPLHISSYLVNLQVNARADDQSAQRRHCLRMGDDVDAEFVTFNFVDRQAYTVDGD
jgi:predicted signal transduction protein with EAL and GGDEF domain